MSFCQKINGPNMSNYMFASSPSWYCTGAIDSDDRGFLYFGANYNLYVLNIAVSPPKYLLHLYAHQQRAVGVSACKHNGLWLCCTIGEDGKVKIWDLEARICLHEHSAHKTALTCVHWSPVDKNLIVSADNKGGIVIWKIDNSEFKYICPEPGHIFAIKCSPHRGNIVAVGYKSSSILILDTEKNGQVIQRLRGHDEEIHGLCWCPVPGEQLDRLDQSPESSQAESASGRSLLASSSKDRTIRVWAVSTGRAVVTLRLHSGGKKDKSDDRVGGRIWVALNWPANRPTQLVSSSFNGEILLWDLIKGGKRPFSASKNSRGHNRLVFNATTGGSDGGVLCTSSMDRQIILWDMDTMKAKYSIPTLGGFGYCISSSPVNPGRLAVGSGDHLIRIWNIDNKANPFDTQTYWQGLKSKVTALKWHPVKESQLAYGTEDGRVGIYDIFSNRPPQISSTYHKGTVYTVCWGPPCVEHFNYSDRSYMLYSCGDGRLLQHEPDHMDQEAKLVNKCIREVNNIQGKSANPSEVCFKPGYKVVAVGNDDGSVDILEVPGLKRLCCIQTHRKLVNVIRWHPEYTAESREPSKYRNWLASGSGEYTVHVLDLTQVLESRSEQVVVLTEATCQLVGHTSRITQLSWSPFHENKIASASYDHTVQIWDVSSCEPLANYRGHYGRLMCVQWSDLDPDVIYSGGQDNTVQSWKISEQQFTHPPVCVIERKKKNKKKFLRDDTGDTTQPEPDTRVAVNYAEVNLSALQDLINQKRQELSDIAKTSTSDSDKSQGDSRSNTVNNSAETLNGLSSDLSVGESKELGVDLSVSDVLGDALTMGESGSVATGEDPLAQQPEVTVIRRDGKERKKKRAKSLFPTSSLRDNRGKVFQHEDCVKLANILYSKGEQTTLLGEELYHIGHFIDRKLTFELLRYEENYHKKNDNMEQRILVEIMKGNLSAVLERASTEGHLTDWLVALSGAGATALWRDNAQKMAEQLEKEGFIHKAMSYLLAARKVTEAIDMLARNGAYKEAVCLARIRLAPNDPKLKSVYLEWAHHMFRDANLEMAAKCYLACFDPVQAAVCLSRRADLSALQAAAFICLTANEMQAAQLYTRRLVQDCFMAFDWERGQEVVSSHPQFLHYGLSLSCHELLLTQLCEMQLLPPDLLQTAKPTTAETKDSAETIKIPKFLMNTSDMSLCPWTVRLVAGEAFSHSLVRLWVELSGLCLAAQKLNEVYKTLSELKAERHGTMQLKQVLSDVSLDISLGILQLLLGDGDQAAEHWSVAIATCVDQQEEGLAEGLCRLLLPQGINKFEKQAKEIHALFVTSSETSANRKTSLTLSQNPIGVHEGGGDTKPIIHSDVKDFTPIALLRAYYCFCVLKYWKRVICPTENSSLWKSPRSFRHDAGFETHSSPGSRKSNKSPQSSPYAQSRTTNSPDNKKNVIVGKNLSSEFSPGIGDAESFKIPVAEKFMNLSIKDLLVVSQCVVWDTQAKKQKIQKSLSQIQQCVSKMIVSHQEMKNSKNTDKSPELCNDVDATESTTAISHSSQSQNSLTRYPSGEYLPMTKKPQDVKPKKKPHKDILHSPIANQATSGAAPMLSMIKGSVVEEEKDIREVNGGELSHMQDIGAPVFDDLGNKTDKEKTLAKEGDENYASGSSECEGLSQICDRGETAILNDLYSNLPDDWFQLPIDAKYSADYVSVQLLTFEQKKLQEELVQFPPDFQRVSFPGVLKSVSELSQVLREQTGPDYRDMCEALAQWTEEHKYLSEHQRILETLQQCIKQNT